MSYTKVCIFVLSSIHSLSCTFPYYIWKQYLLLCCCVLFAGEYEWERLSKKEEQVSTENTCMVCLPLVVLYSNSSIWSWLEIDLMLFHSVLPLCLAYLFLLEHNLVRNQCFRVGDLRYWSPLCHESLGQFLALSFYSYCEKIGSPVLCPDVYWDQGYLGYFIHCLLKNIKDISVWFFITHTFQGAGSWWWAYYSFQLCSGKESCGYARGWSC